MKRKRWHLTSEFKARVAPEAIKGDKTAAEIARNNSIAPAQISESRKPLEGRLAEVFQNKGERSRELEALSGGEGGGAAPYSAVAPATSSCARERSSPTPKSGT